MLCFFFSSRRRHTRWPRDWSSDVCSSDLRPILARRPSLAVRALRWSARHKLLLGCAAAVAVALLLGAALVYKHALDVERGNRAVYSRRILDGICLLHIGCTPVVEVETKVQKRSPEAA